ncbi:hypothetical protein IQ268_15315 [Oculatella sp. LEGE 06141]|uniref:hypothetical protein n=1 Tax=Oculatella sp. LEGE 06141 TaxID=1828648 RepID=UPI001880C106|nr:hypothetical protein [Oculatella sp. LEGE 06141]MBE9179940.1 hypothetical protein [Oculatella sp. LEGE 06141]
MDNVISFFKRIRLTRVVVALFAGALLLLNTACNPSSPRVSGEGTYNERVSQETELYRPIQEPQGGMNNYTDTDPRRDTSRAETKARALSREAEQNIQKVQNPGDFAKSYREGAPLGERVRNITQGVGEAAEDVKEDITQGSQEGARKVRNASGEIGRNAERAADNAQNNASATGRNVLRNTQRAVEDASDYAQDRARDTAKATGRAAENASDSLRNPA